MNMKIIISNNAEALRSALSIFSSTATVEAEYGSTVVEGSVLTLAHHGPRAGRPCPCSIDPLPRMGVEVVGISHVDLDTIGGIMAVMGTKPMTCVESTYDSSYVDLFWALAAQIDLSGVHKVDTEGEEWKDSLEVEVDGEEVTVGDLLNAWWAFSESPEGRVFPPRDGSAVEVDLSVHFKVITTLLKGGEDFRPLIRRGREWAEKKEALEEDSFVRAGEGVVLRHAEEFVNHLYTHATEGCPRCGGTGVTDFGMGERCTECFGMGAPSTHVFRAVVALNTKFKSVTVSLADPVEGVSCRDIVQRLWGPEAGGHAGIAGSPRGREMTASDAEAAFKAVQAALAGR